MNYNMMRSRVKGTEMNRSKKKKKRLGSCNMKKLDMKNKQANKKA